MVPDVIVVNFFCPTEPGRGKMIDRVGHDECDLAIRLIQHFFLSSSSYLYIMDNIKEHLDSTRYFLISFEVEC